jgi:hypothetical protein
MEKHIPQELQKTSRFGRFFFCLFAALFTLGVTFSGWLLKRRRLL